MVKCTVHIYYVCIVYSVVQWLRALWIHTTKIVALLHIVYTGEFIKHFPSHFWAPCFLPLLGKGGRAFIAWQMHWNYVKSWHNDSEHLPQLLAAVRGHPQRWQVYLANKFSASYSSGWCMNLHHRVVAVLPITVSIYDAYTEWRMAWWLRVPYYIHGGTVATISIKTHWTNVCNDYRHWIYPAQSMIQRIQCRPEVTHPLSR